MEGRSEERGPLLALVPLLREAPTARGGVGRGGKSERYVEWRVGGMEVNKYLNENI